MDYASFVEDLVVAVTSSGVGVNIICICPPDEEPDADTDDMEEMDSYFSAGPLGPAAPIVPEFLLQEDGFNIFQEDGSKFMLG